MITRNFPVILLLATFSASLALAQSVPAERPRARPPSALTGHADWEKGEALLKRIKIPPAPVRTAEEEAKTFKLAPGYRIELVAAEPLVHNPIFFEFDPDGRIWVVEYQGYMRDLAGSGEGDPICRVVVLEDTDGDGRMDKSTVFLDNLVMPRSFAFVKGGVLLQEPPKLWFCESTHGDLRCDKRTQVGRMGVAGNPQHTANGLRYGMDNWLHSADWPKRHRWENGALIEEDTIRRGQFGVSFDDTGRFLTCYENSPLHADLIPAEYLSRNRNFLKASERSGGDRSLLGVNVNIARGAAEVFPIRVTPAITLGALELRDDGRLRTYTIACGVCSYDGNQFPADARGNVFVPESGGHLLGRLRLSGGIAPEASRFHPAEQEFLASTDERFRPVNARVGPDGALYVADLYHGIIEHVIFMVPWLTKQIRERHLDEGNDLGRIWRIVAENQPIDRKPPRLSSATSAELVKLLGHPNGWHRLTAQRLLVERRDSEATPALREFALRGTDALGRLHALWTLDGSGALDWATNSAAMDDPDERVRAAALRCAEHGLDASHHAGLLARIGRAASDKSEPVRLQAALTLGVLPNADTLPLFVKLISENEHPLFRAATLTGLQGRELEFTRLLLAAAGWSGAGNEHRSRMLSLLARCVMEEGDAARIAQLLAVVEKISPPLAWQRDALIEGIEAGGRKTPFQLTAEPVLLTQLVRSSDPRLRERAFHLQELFTWPGAAPLSVRPDGPPLTAAQQKLVDAGREPFILLCAPCHQPHGGGTPNVAPPLAGSDWIAGPPERIVRVVLHGLYGPVEINGNPWNLAMPALGATGMLSDEKLAAILSYVRRSWGNSAPIVEPSLVEKVRKETAGRTLPWTAAELASVGQPAAVSSAPLVKPGANGEIILPASKAATYGQKLAYRPALDILAPWRVKEDVAEWRIEIPAEGRYEVFVTLAADDASAGDEFVIETEGSRTKGTVLSSGGYERFREVAAGKLDIKAGINRVLMHPEGPLRQELADVRAVRLVPVK